MNPNVIFTDDPLLHLRNIKVIPEVDERIDRCIECGLCEPFCPSSDLSLSPRERINVLREIRIMAEGNHQEHNLAHRIQQDFRYEGVETCARDGLCALSCPVNINTGDMMKAYHAQLRGRGSRALSLGIARRFKIITFLLRPVLAIAGLITRMFQPGSVHKASRWVHRYSRGLIPAWTSFMPGPADPLPEIASSSDADLVYFPSCLSRTLSGTGDDTQKDLPESLLTLVSAAGLKTRFPENVKDLCCGLAFHSKGFTDASVQSATRVVDRLWENSNQGKIPIVMDTTPCSRFMQEYDRILSGVSAAKWRQLEILDVIEYLHDVLLPKLELEKIPGEAVLHPTCSSRGLEITDKMLFVAEQCAESVVIPAHTSCCGFAGDRGLLQPELTEAATGMESQEVAELKGDAGHYSTSRTCEIGMSAATEQPYESLIYLVLRALQQN